MTEQMTYKTAAQLRSNAEQTNDPALYIQAAEAFRSLGMEIAAQRLEDRAAHYMDVMECVA